MSYISDTSAQDTVVNKKPRSRLWTSVACIAVALVSFFIIKNTMLWASGLSAVSKDKLKIEEVLVGDFIRDISVQGKIVAAKRPVLYSSAQGTVTYLVDAGDSVQFGEVIAEIDSPELKSELEQEAALLRQLETQLQRQIIASKQQDLQQENFIGEMKVALSAAKREMRRSEEGKRRQVVNDIDYQKAKDDLKNAQREHDHALKEVSLLKESQKFEIKTKELELEGQRVKVAELKRQVASLNIRSPVSGLVGNWLMEQKSTVSKNQALVSVVDLSRYEVEVEVPESYADDLALGMLADIILNNVEYQAELVAISPEILKGTVRGKLRFIDSDINGLRQNQRLTSRIVLEYKENVAYLPRGQFASSGNGFVYVVSDEGVASKREIKLGAKSLSQVEVISGLNEGELVVVSDASLFKDASSIRIIQ